MFSALANLVKSTSVKPLNSATTVAVAVPRTAAGKRPRDETAAVSNDDPPAMQVKASLRRLGLPVTLFGESDADRLSRLRDALREPSPCDEPAVDTTPRPPDTSSMPVQTQEDLRSEESLVEEASSILVEQRRVAEELQPSVPSPDELEHALSPRVATGSPPPPVVAAHRFAAAYIRFLMAAWRLRVGHLSLDAQHAPHDVRQYRRHATSLEPLLEVLDDLCCPPTILRCLTGVFLAVARGAFLDAENCYYAVAMGPSAWRIGIHSGTLHERSKTAEVHRGTVKHIMNNEVVRGAMIGVKMLIGEAQRLASTQP